MIGSSISEQQPTETMVDSNGFAVQVARKALMVSSLHRPLDRSHSEPAWQQQQQQPQDKQTNSSRYKTELCRPFEENGFCKYGDKCQFAHGGNELRTLNRHPKYKTELCRTFHTIGICPYGPRCHFIHNAEESRVYPNVLQTVTPPPALIPSPTTPQQHTPLAMTQSLGLSNIFDSTKQSPLNSLNGSPTSPSVFFDDSGSFVFSPNMLLENLAESLASSLQLNNNKLTGSNSPVQQNNSLNARLANHLNNNINLAKQQQQLAEMMREGIAMDTPPASPPEPSSSCSPSSSVGDDKLGSLGSSLRLPVFQSINTVQ